MGHGMKILRLGEWQSSATLYHALLMPMHAGDQRSRQKEPWMCKYNTPEVRHLSRGQPVVTLGSASQGKMGAI